MSHHVPEIEDTAVNPQVDNPNIIPLRSMIDTHLSRRQIMYGAGGAAMMTMLTGCGLPVYSPKNAVSKNSAFDFTPVKRGVDGNTHIPDGYDLDILIRWGDAVVKNAPDFDPLSQTPDKQEMQFGYNNDYIGILPLPMGASDYNHALLCVNHEYALEYMMFPAGNKIYADKTKKDIMMASMGNSIVEIKRDKSMKWHVVSDSIFNRRISLRSTVISVTGPAAGHDRMKTDGDKTGTRIIGTFQNCAGGITPWGTYLTCEENINNGFGNLENADKNNTEIKKSMRFGLGVNDGYHTYYERFDLSKNPNEINRFGWVVEIDPYNPTSTPRKHTALGRCKHEGCTVTISKNGHAVAYMGDDQHFEYIYKFISKNKYNPNDRSANMNLLTDGTLYVAKFHDDGMMEWLPLVYGQNGLTAENGFASQGDICIDARLAADFVGATPLDRPEDVEIHPETGAVYVTLTKNPERVKTDKVNSRSHNMWGQIVEITTHHDHESVQAKWDILLMGSGDNTADSLSCPDNLSFDSQNRLWVATDQGVEWGDITAQSDGLYGVETAGEHRGKAKLFFRSPVGAETTGICFTPDSKTLFLSVQHPSSDGTEFYKPFGKPSNFDNPATRWPDFQENMPPRPSVVQITHKGKVI
jgi:uncharacterized protein